MSEGQNKSQAPEVPGLQETERCSVHWEKPEGNRMRVSQPIRKSDKEEESRSEPEVHRSQEPGFAFQWKRGGKHIPRAEEAHLSVDVSRGPWSRTPGPLALVPEAAIILRPHKLFPTLQRNPKKVEVRSLRVTPEQEGLHCYSGSCRRLLPFCSPSLSLEFPHTNAPSAVCFFANIS